MTDDGGRCCARGRAHTSLTRWAVVGRPSPKRHAHVTRLPRTGGTVRAMLELRCLGVTYPGPVVALRDVTLSFRAGEFTVLLGRSGAGKSTLLRCLNGLVGPTTGRVLAVDGGDLAR